MKPCRVNLTRLPNIKISCSANAAEKNVELSCKLQQTSSYDFTIKISRKRSNEEMNSSSISSRLKRFKLDTAKTNDIIKPMAGRKKSSKKPSNQLVLNKFKTSHAKTAVVGDVVLCKIRGFPDWPAIVIEVVMPDKKGLPRITVRFFGDKTTHTTTITNIFPFIACRDLMIAKLCGRKHPLYGKSIAEAQGVLQVKLIDDSYL